MTHSPFSSCAERGARNQDARSFPTPWWTGQKWRWNLPERARLHRGGPDSDHLQGSTFRRARLLLSGHSWSLRGRRCPHHAQSLLWVCPFHVTLGLFNSPRLPNTHTHTHFPISNVRNLWLVLLPSLPVKFYDLQSQLCVCSRLLTLK